MLLRRSKKTTVERKENKRVILSTVITGLKLNASSDKCNAKRPACR